MKGLLKSFVYAGSGIITCIRQERNMRVHLVCMIYMYSYLLIYDFFEVSRTQFAIIFIANAIVVMGELFNTAIEAVVDMAEEKFSERYNRLAKYRKIPRREPCLSARYSPFVPALRFSLSPMRSGRCSPTTQRSRI